LKQNFKYQVIIACSEMISSKLKQLQAILNQINEASANETKSTAGDKHETAKAMLQLEQEKLGKQIWRLQLQQNELNKIDANKIHTIISNGSVIKTGTNYLFIGVGLGKIKVQETEVIALSAMSPLATQLMGLKANDKTVLNEHVYLIEELS
jgi:transcription elongation GreA/GreB family factor